jgi:hypothetical protein
MRGEASSAVAVGGDLLVCADARTRQTKFTFGKEDHFVAGR